MGDIYQTPEADLEIRSNIDAPGYGSIEKGIKGEYELNIGNVLSEAWSLTKGAKTKIHLGLALYFVIYFAIAIVTHLIAGLLGVGAGLAMTSSSEFAMGNMLGLFFGYLVVSLVIVAASTPLTAGIMMMGIRRSVGAPIPASTVLNYWGKTVPLAVAIIILTILIYLGMALFVLPGLFLAVATCMTLQLIADKNLGPWQAMVTSLKAVTKKWFTVFGIFIVLGVLNIVVFLPLMIGVFSQSTALMLIGLIAILAYIWLIPFCIIVMGVIYRNIFGYSGADEQG